MRHCLLIASFFVCSTVVSLSQGATISFQSGDLRLDGNLVGVGAGYTTGATWIRANDANANLNGGNRILAGSNFGSGPLRTLLEFDLQEIANQGPLQSVDSVQLVVRSTATAGVILNRPALTLNLHSYGFDLAEGTSTWNNPSGLGLDATAGGTLGTTLTSLTFNPTTTNSDFTFPDAVAFRQAIADALASPGQTMRMLLKDDAETTSVTERSFAEFIDDEFATVEFRPELIVSFTLAPPPAPEPSTAAFLSTLLGGAVVAHRRSRREIA